jgi:hypothetical protein
MNTTWIKDTAERCVFTFLEAWPAAWLLLADAKASNLFDPKVLNVGLVAAVAAFVKAVAARNVGDPESASLVPEV